MSGPAARAPAVIEVTGVRTHRGNTVVLDGIDWCVRKGEHWAILGPNGCGKTSLLSTLTAYDPPTRGTIRVLGQEYGRADWRDLRTRIGIVSSAVLPLMFKNEDPLTTVVSGKGATMGLLGATSAADEASALAILRRIECEHLRGRPWRVLSQGERQRVLIGRALMADPALLILDEPCAGLDPGARERFLRFLSRLAEKKSSPTLVLVTHHVEEIIPAVSHVLVLREGRVLALGKKSQVLTSSTLSRAFGAKARVTRRASRYELRLDTDARYLL